MLLRHEIATQEQGLFEITPLVAGAVEKSAIAEGLCTLFLQHTSASLTIQENADPAAVHDLEGWLNRLVPENDPRFTHTAEGPDDMPSHIKTALTTTSLAIPIENGRLALGTWQGIFLWEHRTSPKRRRLLIHLGV
jgi:secondary thiamine-phosphate synthase enzyme